MEQYHHLVKDTLSYGNFKTSRTGVDTISRFGAQYRYDLSAGFPLITTKKVHLKSVIHELLWMIKGESNIGYLKDNGVRIWNEWANEEGELGPVYGVQWRNWNNQDIDQIAEVIHTIKNNPDSRRMMITAWNPEVLPDTNYKPHENATMGNAALPPCHAFFQFYVADGKLSCQLYQRSADIFLGVPFNIASYSLFLQMMAQVTDLQPGEFIHSFGDRHVYSAGSDEAKEAVIKNKDALQESFRKTSMIKDPELQRNQWKVISQNLEEKISAIDDDRGHLAKLALQNSREYRALPKMNINPDIKHIDDFTYNDFELVDYDPHPLIPRGNVAV